MDKVIWPFSRFCTKLPIEKIDEYTIVDGLAKNQPPKIVSYIVVLCLLALLALAVYFNQAGHDGAALWCAFGFVASILVLLGLEKILSTCKACGTRTQRYERAEYAFDKNLYRLTGRKCERCKTVEVLMCVDMKLESDS